MKDSEVQSGDLFSIVTTAKLSPKHDFYIVLDRWVEVGHKMKYWKIMFLNDNYTAIRGHERILKDQVISRLDD